MDYLKEPKLVAKIQQFFGVRTNFSDKSVNSDGYKTAKSGNQKEYILTNKYWYYLFVFGTALGDETFYSAFIPFWFWNIDGAVGRRVVLVWTIVMYIGKEFTVTFFFLKNALSKCQIWFVRFFKII